MQLKKMKRTKNENQHSSEEIVQIIVHEVSAAGRRKATVESIVKKTGFELR